MSTVKKPRHPSFLPVTPPLSPEFAALYGAEDAVGEVVMRDGERKWMVVDQMRSIDIGALYPQDREANLLFCYLVRDSMPSGLVWRLPPTVEWMNDSGNRKYAWAFATPTSVRLLVKNIGGRLNHPINLVGFSVVSVNPFAVYSAEELHDARITGEWRFDREEI